MLEGMEGVLEQMRKTKSEWFVANNLLKDLLNQRSGFLGHSAASSLSSTVPESSQRPRKRRREEATSSSSSTTNHREDLHKDREYCLPLEDINQLPSDIEEALRKAEENDEYDYT